MSMLKATGFAFKDKTSGEWVNLDVRLAPPKSVGHFEETLAHTLILMGLSVEEVSSLTEQGAEKGAGQGKGKGKGKR